MNKENWLSAVDESQFQSILDSQEKEKIAEWVRTLLSFDSALAEIMKIDEPYLLIYDAYEYNPNLRALLKEIYIEMLTDFLNNPESIFRMNSLMGDQLLLLSDFSLPIDGEEDADVEYQFKIAETLSDLEKIFRPNNQNDLNRTVRVSHDIEITPHLRCLQMMNAHPNIKDAKFYLSLEQFGQEYVQTIFAGLCRIDVKVAVDFLLSQTNKELIKKSIRYTLYSIADKAGFLVELDRLSNVCDKEFLEDVKDVLKK